MKNEIRIAFRDCKGYRQIAVFDTYPEACEYVSHMATMKNSDEYEILAVLDGWNTLHSFLMTEKNIRWEDLVEFFAQSWEK